MDVDGEFLTEQDMRDRNFPESPGYIGFLEHPSLPVNSCMSAQGKDQRHQLCIDLQDLKLQLPTNSKAAARESKYGDGMMYWTDTRVHGTCRA